MQRFIYASVVVLMAVLPAGAEDAPDGARTVKLKNGKLVVREQGGAAGVTFVHKNGKFIINTGPDGKPVMHFVQIGHVAHADFNGDGAWDAKYDAEKGKSFIMIGDKTIEVRFDPKLGPGAREKISLDGKTKYVFGGKSWRTGGAPEAADEPIVQRVKRPGGLIAFADAPGRSPGRQAMPHAQI